MQQYSDVALRKTIGGGGGQGVPTPSAAGSRGSSSLWTQLLRGNRGGQGRQHGAGVGVEKNQQHADIAVKLPGMGEEAVIDINSCGTVRII